MKQSFWLLGGVLLAATAGACNRDEFVVPNGPPPAPPAWDGGAGSAQQPMPGAQPPAATPLPASHVYVAAGSSFSCARRGTQLGCWGDGLMVTALGGDAKLGVGGGIVTFGAFAPIPALQPTDLAANGDRICLVQDGQVLCTEADEPTASLQDLCVILGQCGFRLRALQGLPERAVAVDVAPDHACAVMTSGRVACWGRNDRGQLGHAPGTGGDAACPGGSGVCNFVPSYVASLAGATAVSVGGARGLGTSCALSGATLSCWGANQFGQLGLGNADSEPHPEPAMVRSDFRAVSVAATGVCAVSLNGGAYCWGDYTGELNLQAQQPREVSRLSEITAGSSVPLTNVVQIDRGQNHACAVDTGGRVWCWGSNAHGELGRGRMPAFDSVCTIDRQARLCSASGASRVESITDAAMVAVGTRHTCASRRDGKVLCWGNNSDGQVGKPVKEPEDARNFTSATAVAGSSF